MNHKTIYFAPYKRGAGVWVFFSLFLLLSLLSCSEAEQLYSSHRANFVFQNSQIVPQLNSSLHNPGEFCTITPKNNQYIFSSPSIREDYPYERTEIDRVSNYVLGLNGLIVGMPIIAEQLSSQAQVVCFDQACPNCYEDASILRSVRLQLNQKAVCERCQRTYDLNNQGVTADEGKSLYRYRVSVSGNTLVVNNY